MPHAGLPPKYVLEIRQPDRVLRLRLGRLVTDGAQGLHAAGVDALDGADELQLALQGGYHGGFGLGRGGEREGGEAQEVVQLRGRDGLWRGGG